MVACKRPEIVPNRDIVGKDAKQMDGRPFYKVRGGCQCKSLYCSLTVCPLAWSTPVVFNAFTRSGGRWNDMLLGNCIGSRRPRASALALMIDI